MRGLMALFLGLDLSTQALKASLLDEHLRGIDEVSVRFETDLPEFETRGGILPRGHALLGSTPSAAAAPVLLYVAALDMLWERVLYERKWPVDRIAAISALGQQHASVYFAHGASETLAHVDPAEPLRAQLQEQVFSRAIVPNWQDATTLEECTELMQFAQATWGAEKNGVAPLCQKTGSIAHTRFTAAQVLRWRKECPEAYRDTARITLVSNFLSTLLCAGNPQGTIAGVDRSDACGMNLWDMESDTPHWSAPLLSFISDECTAKNTQGTDAFGGADALQRKLGSVYSDPCTPVDKIGTYFQRRYGLSPTCIVCQSTGDNPGTLQCLTPQFGEAVLSLGTSDTILLPSNSYTPNDQYHVFAHPASRGTAEEDTPRYFLMFVYKNGSLAREWVRDTYFNQQWSGFNAALMDAERVPPGDAGTGFYWLQPEIIPWDARGTFRFRREKTAWHAVPEYAHSAHNAPAMVQSQFMEFRSRIQHNFAASGSNLRRLKRVYVVGGAAENTALCQLLANVLGCEVAKPVVSGRTHGQESTISYNYGSVGAAYRARWVWER
ncbi:hypothetical protein MVES_000216 [Malassezia vespertilionis]|uniref:Xylulose kinase n=1 Tax=Malassezia vespertilionis TaxID=2020962 RepID=A0A2N1JG55_9BASI|nr:hypothetical protein MVES_000216 [Malassezia vespertilionis]